MSLISWTATPTGIWWNYARTITCVSIKEGLKLALEEGITVTINISTSMCCCDMEIHVSSQTKLPCKTKALLKSIKKLYMETLSEYPLQINYELLVGLFEEQKRKIQCKLLMMVMVHNDEF